MSEASIKDLLRDLSTIKGIRVTGSWARGTNHHASDLDLCVRGNTALRKAIGVVEAHGFGWDSILVGQIATSKPWDLPVVNRVEVMERMWLRPVPRAEREPAVSILGSQFKTW